MKKVPKYIQKKESLKQVKSLFEQAKSSSLADKLVKKARKIGMKINLKLPRELKRKFCKHCNTYFKSGNYRVRTRNKTVVYYCLTCKKYMRFSLSKFK